MQSSRPLVVSASLLQRWVACAAVGLGLLVTGLLHAEEPLSLEPGGRETVKRLNETLTRAGYPALPSEQIGTGARVGVVLSEEAAHQAKAAATADPLRSPMAAGAVPDPAKVTAEQVAEERGITGEQAEEIHEERSIAYADLLTLPTAALREAVFEHEREAGDHPAEAMRWEESFKVDEFGKVDPAAIERARRQAQALPLNTRLLPADVPAATKLGTPITAQSLTPTSWTWKGPGNIGGRIRTMVIHPTQTNRLWIGSVGGGIWYSSDSGASWSAVNDFMSNLAVSTLAMDPTNPSNMYAGTGEGFYNADGIRGAGIYKSTDGGVTWAQLSSTANNNFLYVNRLAISPDGTTLLAATSSAIYRSLDGGTSWTLVFTGSTTIGDVEFHPTDSTKAVASGYAHQLLYSTNGGATWTAATGGGSGGTGYNGGRIEVRYARSSPTTTYATFDYGSASQLFKSADGGATYAKVFDSATAGTANWLSSQGWYANALWVSPVDPAVVVVGGLDIYRSTNGGTSFTKISYWQSAPASSAHADHHGIFSDPGYNASSNNLVYFTNDGGIYKAANVSTVSQTSGWTALNNQLGITQFYGAGVNATTGTIVAGAQDNGTVRYTTSAGAQTWSTMFGGDGGNSAADQANSAYFYGEYVYLDIHRSTNSGASSSYIYTGISDANSGTSEFIAPFILDPNNQATLLAGGTQLWRTTNARASTVSWASIKAADGTSHITAVAVAPGNSDIIWVGHLNGDVYLTTNGTATSPTWTKMDDNATALPARRVTRISIDPTNSSRVYVTFGGYTSGNVWQTTNAGASWSNSTGTLPAAPVYDLAISPSTPQTIYAGTDVGVFASDNGGATWSTTNIGPTLASVQQLFVSGANLVTVTHGRGVFTAPLSVPDTTPPTLTITPADGTPTNASPVAFRFDWSEAVTGFTLSDVQITGGTASTLAGSNANYTLSVTPASSITAVTVTVPANAVQDLAGNANTTSTSATVNDNYQSPFLYSTAFDGKAAPTGWSANGDWQWGTPTSGPGSDHTSGSGQLYATVLAGNYSDSASEYLTTPTFTLPSSGLPYQLRFWMWMNSESTYDGGNLEISANGGAFSVVPSASLSVPYNDTAIASMPGGLGWDGTTYAAWTRVRLNLSAYAGSTVQFRYHFTSDGSVNYAGWYIDDFALEQDPTVTLSASDAVASDGGNTAAFRLNLFPAAPDPLSVGYSIAGSAVNGTDYTVLSGVAAVPAGALANTISVVPINRNGARAKTQTVILALASGTGYTVGSPNTATVYIAGEAGYDAWRAAHFTDAEFTNDLVSGPAADPDGDGIANLLEYSLGLDPKKNDASGLPTPQIVNVSGQNYLSLSVVKPQSNTDVTYGAEVSDGLVNWTGSSSAVQTTTQSNTPAGYDTVTFRDLTPLGSDPANRRFLRLRLTPH